MKKNSIADRVVTLASTNTPRSTPMLLGAVVVALFAFSAQSAKAQISAYDFFGQSSPTTATANVLNANLDSSLTLTRGAGAASSAGANSFRTVGFQNDGIATTNTDYFQFTLSAASGYTLSISSLDTRVAGTAGFFPATTTFAYSLDGAPFTLITPQQVVAAANSVSNTTPTSFDTSGIAALQNVVDTTTVTFRYYATGQTTTGGFGFFSSAAGVYGLDTNGTLTPVAPVPEPATVFGGLLLVGIAFWNQRGQLRGLLSGSLAACRKA